MNAIPGDTSKPGASNSVIPSKLTVHNFDCFLDGGTVVLHAADEISREHGLMLVQHAWPQPNPSLGDSLPGRLYFDDELIPIRSDAEREILALLRSADIHYAGPNTPLSERIQLSSNALILGEDIRQVFHQSPEDNLRRLLQEVTQFVESEAYVRFASSVEQAADPRRYTVWPAYQPATRAQVIVRLGRVLGVGVPVARSFLDSGEPLKTSLTALEVAELAGQYAANGLALRVEPPFRWKLS